MPFSAPAPWLVRLAGLLLISTIIASAWMAYWPREAAGPSADYWHTVTQAQTHFRIQAVAERDSARATARRAKVVYVSERRHAADAVALVPHFTTSGDTITLAEGPMVVPHPVAVLVTRQRTAIDSLTVALASADTALAADSIAQAKSDRAADAQHAEDVARLKECEATQPGRAARFWNAVKAPVMFVGGVAVGAGTILLVQGVTK